MKNYASMNMLGVREGREDNKLIKEAQMSGMST